MKLYTAGRKPAPPADPSSAGQEAERVLTSDEDPRLKGFDYLFRSILTEQGMHNTDMRESTRDQKRLLSSTSACS
jgi:hypothetical protein